MGGEPHQDPRVVVVSPTTGVNQSGEPTMAFVEVQKVVHTKVNLEGQIHLEEDPHAPRSAPQAYSPPNHQTKVKDPTGAGKLNQDLT